jgi:hypothetical protein
MLVEADSMSKVIGIMHTVSHTLTRTRSLADPDIHHVSCESPVYLLLQDGSPRPRTVPSFNGLQTPRSADGAIMMGRRELFNRVGDPQLMKAPSRSQYLRLLRTLPKALMDCSPSSTPA